MSKRVEFEFPGFGLKGLAIAFTLESFERYIDGTIRNADDAAQAVLARNVEEPPFEELEAARRRFPLLANRLCDILVEVAGFARESAILEEALNADTPRGVLAMAGLPPEDATKLREQHAGEKLLLVVVRDSDRKRLFSCVLRPDSEAARLIREDRKNGKGFAKACRSAALSAIVWSDQKPEDAFEAWPAIPVMCLADKIGEVAGVAADRRFRQR